jgi:hypothetical protein
MRWTSFERKMLATFKRGPQELTPRERWLKLLVIRLVILNTVAFCAGLAALGVGALASWSSVSAFGRTTLGLVSLTAVLLALLCARVLVSYGE